MANGKVLDFNIDVDEYDLNFSESINPNSSSQNLNYNSLINKPQINNIELIGNKTAESLGLATLNDIPTIPVQSVNGKTGAVNLTAADVGAKPDSYQVPVSSVAGKTGAVTLGAGDVDFGDQETYQDGTVGKELSRQLNAIDAKADKTTYVTLSGTIVTQTGADNTMYLCGELAELTFTAPATGITAIRFTSGTTPTVATFSGVTWLNGFDPTAIEASKTYEINILNGLGCAAWT